MLTKLIEVYGSICNILKYGELDHKNRFNRIILHAFTYKWKIRRKWNESDKFIEKMLDDWMYYILEEILDPIFGKFGADLVLNVPFLPVYLTIAEIFFTAKKELKIRVYYPLKKMWLRRTPCILEEISYGVYKIKSSNNAIENAHELGSQTFAQFMAYRIVQGTNHLPIYW